MAECVCSAPAYPKIAWESTDCLLCGGNRRTIITTAQDFDAPPPQPCYTVVRCLDCDLCYTNPRPSEADIGRFYYDGYVPHQLQSVRPKRNGKFRQCRRSITSKMRPDWEHGEIKPIGQNRLLDFGCGSGGFLHVMYQRGWQVLGIDFSSKAVQQVQEELGLPALAGTLPHPDLAPSSFDLITLWHALEHVHQPLDVLCEIHRLLAPGGKVLVAVPNIDSAPFHWLPQAWFGLDLPRHLTHFTPVTLKEMLYRAGFQFEAIQMARHSYWLRQSVQRACRRGKISLPLKLLQYNLPSSFVSRCYLLAGRSDSFIMIAKKPDEM